MPNRKDEHSKADEQNTTIFRNWTQDDSKLLIITIVATVLANIITVVLVALAVIIARSSRPHPGTPGNWAFFFGSCLFAIVSGYSALWFFRDSRRKKATDSFVKVIKLILAISAISTCFIASLYILALIGLAAGVR
jgi:small-conductance mechanosensitive channel